MPVGTTESEFSNSWLDLQDGFCCFGSGDKLIRWLDCTPGIYKGRKTIFSSKDMSLCSWYQAVTDYSFDVVTVEPEQVLELSVDAEFLMVKIVWPTEDENGNPVADSDKIFELSLNAQSGYVGMHIPFFVGPEPPDPPQYDYRNLVVKDLFVCNTKSVLGDKIRLNNISVHEVTVGVLAAK